ncbi:hypothetical protein PROFUN_12897 [Planoprotostelium fungivorum]|uniref:Uncharacterized protein n=1 Tax=Planoprotostelium fungivorum TaxID=1890364 RepID=A0A2P6MWI9_9EUKA|nr:hypothetical protein PROFUN_12897 [Planoprotostelium fungivorum]
MDDDLLLVLSTYVEILMTLSLATTTLSSALVKYKKLKTFKRKLGHRKERDTAKQQAKRLKTRPRGRRIPRQLSPDTDIYDRTGLYAEEFFKLLDELSHDINQSRNHGPSGTHRVVPTVLSADVRLMMILEWLRTYPSMKKLARDYGVSKAFHIRWPAIESDWVRASDFENTVAAIDCSTHYRNRVHPRQADYYRFDKKGFSITAQLICGLDGKIWRVDFGNGHNNDSGMVELTGLKDVLHQNPNLRNLADSGLSRGLKQSPCEIQSRLRKTQCISFRYPERPPERIVSMVMDTTA